MPQKPRKIASSTEFQSERSPERYKGEALARAARVLALFGAATPERTLTDLVAATGVPKATLHGILDTLVARGLLVEDSGRYRLGFAWLKLGDVRRNQLNIRESAQPLMRAIRDAVNETVILSLKVGDRRVHLDYIESTQPIRRITQLGNEASLHTGAAARVLLAGLGPAELDSYFARTSEAAMARDEITSATAAIRRDGYAVVSGTVNAETAAVAAPVRNSSGETIAALTISCPRLRFTADLKRRCIALVVDGAGTLSRTLGYAP